MKLEVVQLQESRMSKDEAEDVQSQEKMSQREVWEMYDLLARDKDFET